MGGKGRAAAKEVRKRDAQEHSRQQCRYSTNWVTAGAQIVDRLRGFEWQLTNNHDLNARARRADGPRCRFRRAAGHSPSRNLHESRATARLFRGACVCVHIIYQVLDAYASLIIFWILLLSLTVARWIFSHGPFVHPKLPHHSLWICASSTKTVQGLARRTYTCFLKWRSPVLCLPEQPAQQQQGKSETT